MDINWKEKKNSARPGDNFFLHPGSDEIEALTVLAVDKISKLYSTLNSSERSPVLNLEHYWKN